ncbi:Crp/Fnr family transcriptional regulator [Hydrogenophaga sp.]|uniref:Crp/Fnr family transcriptional regulator n=1 Tax=Hydrogenophaga sp. TaxID=1904254 RepID=UPI0027208AA3|nr:Crp/Fnr family transcriptional regulator [Hydrogenophaga sp.]MDO9132216.1 Crp/Fnr family transcriptional regulator [Hydrogenophaga sp.]
MIAIQTQSAWRGTSDCRSCAIRELALFSQFTEKDFALIHAPIDDLAYRAHQVLFNEGDEAGGIFTLRSGMVKLTRITGDGRRRILRLLRPGDVVGLEALATGRYDSEAAALTDITLCRIPTEVVHRLNQNSPRMHAGLLDKWQKVLREADDWLASINFGTARQRVSHFILKMRHTTDPAIVTLFSREDMGAMMDLKHETVSREISALVKTGAVKPVDTLGRLYRILDESLLVPAAH